MSQLVHNSETNITIFQEEIKCRLKLGNACYYSVQNLLSSSLLSKTLKIKIRGLLEKYPTFGREKETGLLGALDT